MCGILITNRLIKDLSYIIKYLKNRGPDHTGIFELKGFSFIHVLLSMTGSDMTCQPFYYQEDDIVILFNGEIYNYKDFGNYNSDGECLIDIYKKYGDNFIKQLDGEFAIVLCDFKNNILFYSTDIFSIKPLWVSIENNDIGISSYESCLKRLGFNNINQVDPDTTVKINLNNLEILSKISVYDFDLNQYKDTYDDWNNAFEEAVLKRCRNIKHKIFIGLSSGYDSGAIACVLNKFGIDYKAYTIIGSENYDIIKKRFELINDAEIIYLTKEKFLSQKEFLKNNCEEYFLTIDNDEQKNLEIWKKKLNEFTQNGNKIMMNKANKKIKIYEKAIILAKEKKLTEDNGSIGLGYICSLARPNNQIIYLTGSGADEIMSDYGWNGVKHYRHSTIGGYFPEDLKSVFPWKNFFMNTQRAYLRKEEYVAGTYGIEGRYPFLDKNLVQEFLWLKPELKNVKYKAPLHNYLEKHNFPFDINKKMGFNCGFSSAQNENIKKQIATRTDIGVTNDKSLVIDKNKKK